MENLNHFEKIDRSDCYSMSILKTTKCIHQRHLHCDSMEMKFQIFDMGNRLLQNRWIGSLLEFNIVCWTAVVVELDLCFFLIMRQFDCSWINKMTNVFARKHQIDYLITHYTIKICILLDFILNDDENSCWMRFINIGSMIN